MELVVALVLLVALVAGWRSGVFQDRIEPDLDEPFLFDTADGLGSAFEDYQQSVTQILDRDPQRRDDLRRELDAATAIWERAEFEAAVKPLQRDREFRRSIRAAERAANDQT